MNTLLFGSIRSNIKIYFTLSLFLLLLVALNSCGGGGGGGGTLMPPATPAGVRGLSGDMIVVVGWNTVPGATSYNIYMASTPGVTKSNYEVKLTGVSQPYTITGLTNGQTYYIVVTAANGAGESGESAQTSGSPVTGAGDAGNYFPFTAGNTWTLSGTCSGLTGTYSNVITTETGTFNGAMATIFSQSNSSDSGTPGKTYLLKNGDGVIYLGNDDATDTMTPKIVPYWEVQFPLQAGVSFEQMNKTGLDSGEDLDKDGINDLVDVHSVVSVITTTGTVTVPAGTFTNAAMVQTSVTMTFTLSATGMQIPATGVDTSWYGQNVGPVENVSTVTVLGITETCTEVLSSYSVQ